MEYGKNSEITYYRGLIYDTRCLAIKNLQIFLSHWGRNQYGNKYCYVVNYKEDIKEYDEIVNQSLWLSLHVTIKGKPILVQNWYNRGIRGISDILSNEGDMILSHIEDTNKINMRVYHLRHIGV